MKIFVVAGTEDGRELAGFLLERGYEVTASVISEYGRKLLEQYAGIEVIEQKLNAGVIFGLMLTPHEYEVKR